MKTAGNRSRGFRTIGARTTLIACVIALVAPVVASADPEHRAPGPLVPPPPPPPPSAPWGHPVGGSHPGNTATGSGAGRPHFLASAKPLRATAERVHILGLESAVYGASIPLAGGGRSPSDTVYLRMREITGDNLVVTQNVNGRSITIQNISNHDESLIVRGGNKTSTLEFWFTVNSAKLCVTAETFNTLVTTYAGVFGGRLDEVLALIAKVFQPYVSGPLKRVGPCIPIKELVPLVSVIVESGVPLPDDLPVEKVDVNLYSAHIASDPNLRSVVAPAITLEVN